MRRFIVLFLMGFLTFSLVINDVAAKRFSFGRMGSARTKSFFTKSTALKKTSTLSQSATKSKWRGVLGGMLMGGLLASLFMGHGITSALLSWMFLGFIVFLIMNFLSRKRRNASFYKN